MGVFTKLMNGITGGVVDEIVETAKEYFPPDMSEKERADFELKAKQIDFELKLRAEKAANEAEKQLTERVAMLEGTASDLKSIPILGRIVLFLRGLQRPLWGFATLYLDFIWFTGMTITMTDRQEQALIVINFLVLGFLFGERAVKNVGPYVIKMFNGRKPDYG